MSRLPRLLDSSFQEVARLRPSSLAMTLALTPPCTATMTLPDGEPPVSMRQWVEMYGPDGKSAGIFRVSSVSTAYGDEQRVQLEHGIATLDDTLVVLGKDAQGVDIREISGTMQDILSRIISQQTTQRWQLGTVEVTGDKTYTVTAGFSSALQAMVDAVKQVSGYALTFDQTTTPWTVSLKALSSGVACECRMRRNMAGVTVSFDDSDLCTRAYSGALEGGYMDADTVSAWGVVGKQLNIDDTADASEAKTFAENYLDQHKNPTLTVEVDALRLAEITGEPLDAFTLGALCRVALPDWSVSMDERIISMTYSDLLSQPESVRLTLSNPGRDVSSRLAGIQQEVRRSGGRSSGGIARAMAYITEVDGELTLADQRISLLATDVNQAAIRLNGAEASITAQGVVLDDLGNRVSSAEVSINGMEATIDLKVSKDGVVSAINMSTEGIKIKASKIELSGTVIAGYLSGTNIDVSELSASMVYASGGIQAPSATIDGAYIGDLDCDSLSIGGATAATRTWVTNQGYSKLTNDSLVIKGYGQANLIWRKATASDGSSYYFLSHV
ncbi:MAG: phage tail spike protein [Aristaeellaceae bacterium]